MSDPPWPHSALDVERLRAAGEWRPVPFREFVLKVHQRCNLACNYCYVYELADQSWRDRPAAMSPAVWRAAATRIAEHVRTHDLPSVSVVLHGGEPLLAGRARLAELIGDLHAELDGLTALTIGMQTNGVLLDDAMLGLLHGAGVRIGVSLDGPAAAHDRHRRRRDGAGSFTAVESALVRLGSPAYRSSFAGLLCTVDPDNDPIETFETLLAYAPPAVDLLLPHATGSTPPPLPTGRYADWLIRVFDRWYDADRRETSVRLFEDVISLLLGGPSRSEHVGLTPVALAVVESDGTIEQVDALKAAYPGAAATGRTVTADPFDAVLTHPGIVARQIGLAALSDTCLSCELRAVCGGGHYAHRYRAGHGFRNPSVYCDALFALIDHIRARVTRDLSQERRSARS